MNNREKTGLKNDKQGPSDLWNNNERFNIHIIRVPMQRSLLLIFKKKKMTEHFLNLRTDIFLWIQEANQTLNMTHPKKFKPTH